MKNFINLTITLLSLAIKMNAQTFVYDRKSQLTGIDYDSFTISYTYDKLGNRIQVQHGPVLPVSVNVQSFTGNINRCTANLYWQVGIEEGTASYKIERSIDGHTFNTIVSMPVKGHQSYEYTDNQMPKGNAYYRLAIITTDNTKYYTSVVRLVNTCNVVSTVQMFPNPAKQQLKIAFRSAMAGILASVIIVDIHGRTVLTSSFNTIGDMEQHSFNLSSLAAGVYVCRLYVAEQKEAEEKIVIDK